MIAHRDIIGAHIPNDVIDYNKRSNPDGFGIAWRDPKEGLLHEKFSPSQANAFHDLLKSVDKEDVEYVAHFRKATHGPACTDLSHPFLYTDASGKELLAFHNGIIDIKTNKGESDTLAFVKGVLARLEHKWWENPGITFLVEQAIGWSRFLLMSHEESIIINEDAWSRVNGIFYSTNPLPWTPKASTTPARTVPAIPSGWLHMGHRVVPKNTLDTIGDEGDKYGEATCVNCRADGEYYVIDGTLFIDIDHDHITDDMVEWEEYD